MSVERIDNPFQGSDTYGHEFRYRLAKGFVRHRLDVVLDAAQRDVANERVAKAYRIPELRRLSAEAKP